MRRPNRNIEIFSMSVLDMFASALGAFIMIAVILFPYYKAVKELEKTKSDIVTVTQELQQVAEQIRQLEETSRRQQEEIRQASQAQSLIAQCRVSVSACQATLAKTFLVIGIEWDEPFDVDLYVTDPSGNQFYYSKKNQTGEDFRSSKGQLSLDMTNGPGIELWQNAEADPGNYLVVYRIVGHTDSTPVPVKGWVISRTAGKVDLPVVSVSGTQNDVRVATVTIQGDRSVRITSMSGTP